MISYIIPAYNEEKYLPKTLASLLFQKDPHDEIIVVCNGCTDRTVQIARSYAVKTIVTKNPGVADARNIGAKAAKGEILVFIDADTIIPPNQLSVLLKEFISRNLDMASCRIAPDSSKHIDHLYFRVFWLWLRLFVHLSPHASGCFLVMKKSLYAKVGSFNTKLSLAEDHEYARRAARVGSFGLLMDGYVNTSIRRFDRDGRIRMGLKYIFFAFYRLFVGEVKTKKFHYRFGGYP